MAADSTIFEVAAYTPLCPAGALAPGEARAFDVAGRRIALFRTAEGYHAVEDTCLHAGGPLHEGALEGTTVTCPWHQWQFDIVDGSCRLNPFQKLDVFPVRVSAGVVEILA